ncbi:TPA: hypothetical protein HA239_04925 [Candidatus Woesearchaeota archaeon]|nr:hypothetical protein QT06_C0001G0354 [archaeon GW2011_AR15]MBS3103670.1 hypothetical protein [Candidatus Woesearchaeota archaeon]HIH41728.1 hypothetical protein [Candidatus Woesearchaeota archaeon]
MNENVRKEIIDVLKGSIKIVKQDQLFRLRELSDRIIETAAVYQDRESIGVAVLIYSLSKIYRSKDDVDNFVLPHLADALKALEKDNLVRYEAEIDHIIKDMSEKDSKTKFYVQEVLQRAEIKKGSKMFEQGISMGQAAEALNVSIWDLMDYVGKTRIIDEFGHKTNVKSKIEFTRRLFK